MRHIQGDQRENGSNRAASVLLDTCRDLGISFESVLLNLKRLSQFKAAKPFSFQGQIVYSEPMDLPEIQLAATRVLADILGMKDADKHEAPPARTVFVRIKGKDDIE